MRVNFRQGIVGHQLSGFLLYNNGAIDLKADDRPVTLTLAHQYTDYIFSEDVSVSAAWTGPFDSATTYWLYWDFDMSQFGGSCPPNQYSTNTCQRTFGFTTLLPMVSDVAPAAPKQGQIWYDRENYKHFEYVGNSWVEKLRVFSARLDNTVLTPVSFLIDSSTSRAHANWVGSQIGDYTDVLAGRPLFTETSMPIKRDDGTFLTTEDQFFADKSRVDAIRLESNVYRAQSMVPALAAFSVVAWDQVGSSPGAEDGRIRSCEYSDVVETVIGVLTQNLLDGEVGAVIIQGSITNGDWNWLTGEGLRVGDELWVSDGILVGRDPFLLDPVKNPQRRPSVARVLSNDTIVFQQGMGNQVATSTSEAGEDVEAASVNSLGVVRLSVPAGTGSVPVTEGSTDDEPIVVETSDPRMKDKRLPLPHQHAAVQVVFDPSNVTFTDAAEVQTALENVEGRFVKRIGDTMGGYLTLSSDPLSNLHAVTKQYVDRITSGYIWQQPISLANLISKSVNSVPADPIRGDTYVIPEDTGDWPFNTGEVVQYRGLAEGWVLIANQLSDFSVQRFGCAMDSATVPVGIDKNKIYNHAGVVVFDPIPVQVPPSPAISVVSEDYPLATNPDAFNAYAWNGSKWIKTQGSTISFGNWIHGNKGNNYSVDPQSYSDESTAAGTRAESRGINSVAIGTSATTENDNGVAIGTDARTVGTDTIALGTSAAATSSSSIAIGVVAVSNAEDAIAIGNDVTASHQDSITIGNDIVSTDTNQVSIGNDRSYMTLTDGVFKLKGNSPEKQIVLPSADDYLAVPPGGQPSVTGEAGSLIYTVDGKVWLYDGNAAKWQWINVSKNWVHGNVSADFTVQPNASASNAVAIGDGAESMSVDAFAIGSNALIEANNPESIVIGTGSTIKEGGTRVIAIGADIGNIAGRPVSKDNSISIGTQSSALSKNDVAIGTNAYAFGNPAVDKESSIAIGEDSIAGWDSVVIGGESQAFDGVSPVSDVTIIGSNSHSNRENTIIIGDDINIDVNDTSSAFPYAGEFLKIGTAAGSEMFLMMVGDPSSTGGNTGGGLFLRAPHAQYVLPKYRPNDYGAGSPETLPSPAQQVGGTPIPFEERESYLGGLILDQEHPVDYNNTTEARPLLFHWDRVSDDGEWKILSADYLNELKDVDVDYTVSPLPEMQTLTFKGGVWTPYVSPVRVNGDNGYTVEPSAVGAGSIAIGDGVVANPVDGVVIGKDLVLDLDAGSPSCEGGVLIGTNTTNLNLSGCGVFSVTGPESQILLPSHPTDPFLGADEGSMVWDSNEKSAKIWDGAEWTSIGGGGGGGTFEVPLADVDMPGAPDATHIGTPMYFDAVGSPPSGGVWQPGRADSQETLHTCVLAEVKDTTVVMMITGEIVDIAPEVIKDDVELVPSHFYYLSYEVTGKVRMDEPEAGNIYAPVLQALTPTTAVVLPYRADVLTQDDATRLGKNETASTTYDATAADKNNLIVTTNASAVTVNIPSNDFAFDPDDLTQIHILQKGAGQVTVTVTGGSLSSPSVTTIGSQYGRVSVIQESQNVWMINGDLG